MNARTQMLLSATLFAMAFAATPASAQVEQAAARHIPWSGYWFPVAKGEMLEPLRKYDALTGRNALGFELSRNAPGPHTPEWHGYCHGWASAAVLEQEPSQQRLASVPGGQILLSVGDQKAWYAASHAGDSANWFGDRFGDGQGSDDPYDLHPDMLWQLLKMFIKDQGVPLIMDLDAGPEVWNYPVYAYRVEHQPHPMGGGWQLGQLSLWAADDAVPPDFVGLVPQFHTYTFQFLTRGRAVVAGSSSWIGQSIHDHPDFAWYPFVARSDNPELHYPLVQQLIQGSTPMGPPPMQTPAMGAPGSAPPNFGYGPPPGAGHGPPPPAAGPLPGSAPHIPAFGPPAGPAHPPQNPVDTVIPGSAPHNPAFSSPAGPALVPPRLGSGAPVNVPHVPGLAAPVGPAPAALTLPQTQAAAIPHTVPYIPGFNSPRPQAGPAPQLALTPLSPMQIVATVANRTSKFDLDLRSAEFGKVQYAVGERLQLAGTCGQDGYLYLLHVNPLGELSLIYPRGANEDNRVAANVAFQFPQAGDFEIAGPPGNHIVKAVVTRQPLITGLNHEAPPQAGGRTWQARSLHLCSTQTQVVKSLLQGYVQGKDVNSRDVVGEFANALPEFAQDEVTYYVGPAR